MAYICAIVPAYNEEKTIKTTLQAIKNIDLINHVILVNDGSQDRTAEIARQEGVEVIDLPSNHGKGEAVNIGLRHINADIAVLLDADLGASAIEAGKIISPVLAGQADLCVAAFPPPTRKGGFGLVKKTAAWVIKHYGGFDSAAPLSGQRALNRKALEAVTPLAGAYGMELAMTLKALRCSCKVIEVPTEMKHNETGRDWAGFKHRGQQFIDILKVIIHY